MKEFTVKENEGFRLRVRSWKCLSPKELNSIEFIQETLKDGKVDATSTYNFFMTDADVQTLAKGLTV